MDVVFNEYVMHNDKQEKEKIEPEFVEFEEISCRDVLKSQDDGIHITPESKPPTPLFVRRSSRASKPHRGSLIHCIICY